MYKLEITDDMSDLEKFVRQEADAYVNSTIFLSCISTSHKNIDSVVEKGKDVVPYVIKLYKENGEYSNQNMYTHFFLIVMQRLYGNPFEGYVGMQFAVRYWLKRYEHGMLDDYDENKEVQKGRLVKKWNVLMVGAEESEGIEVSGCPYPSIVHQSKLVVKGLPTLLSAPNEKMWKFELQISSI